VNVFNPVVGRAIPEVELPDTRELVSSIVGNEKLYLRVLVKSDSYGEVTKRGLRFHLHDGNWTQFKELMARQGLIRR